jgi:hypothetical protein
MSISPKNLMFTHFGSKHKITNFLILNELFKNANNNKDIIISDLNICNNNETTNLTVKAFYKTKKLLKYKKLLKKKEFIKSSNKLNKNTNLFNNFEKKNSNLNIKIYPLNLEINKKLLLIFYSNLKKFNSILFSRGFNLFIDFLKTSTLLAEKKLSIEAFLILFANIFKNLNKKRHSQFIAFVKILFPLIIKYSDVIGMKLIINGKLMGKTRASTVKISKGSLRLNSTSSNIVFGKSHIYTLYGAFGFQLWITYKQ